MWFKFVIKLSSEYNSEASTHYKLLPCYENFPVTGPDMHSQLANQEDEDDVENQEDDEPTEDHYALLVRAWEQKVFPTIRRRFRNEAERKDGLEQIRGALQLSEFGLEKHLNFLFYSIVKVDITISIWSKGYGILRIF